MLKEGERFGRLVATGRREYRKQRNGKNITYGEFLCDCGQVIRKRFGDIKRGKISSCGCLRKENTKIMFTTHGCCTKGKSNKLYRTYHGIIERCTNPKCDYYYRYGGRGIKCLWGCFEDFKRDMGEEFYAHIKLYGEKNTTIDRINNDGDYCKENCRWATIKEQTNNNSRNRYEMWNGMKMSITDIYGAASPVVTYSAFTSRYYKLGWPLNDCLYREPGTKSKDVFTNK